MSGLILYTTEDGASRIQLRTDCQPVWLTQAEMVSRDHRFKRRRKP